MTPVSGPVIAQRAGCSRNHDIFVLAATRRPIYRWFMKKIFIPLCSVVCVFSMGTSLFAAPPVMDPKTKREYIASFKNAVEKNNVGLVKEMAKTFKEYGIQGEAEAIIGGYKAENASMRSQIKQEHQNLNDLRDAASQKSIKQCYRLISNLEKKFMSDMLSTATGAVIGGGVAADVRNALNDLQSNYDAALVIKGNANAIKNLDAFAASCTRLIASLDKAQNEVKTCGQNLATISDAFTQAAATVTTKDDTKPNDKKDKKDKKDDKKVITKTPPPKDKVTPPKDAPKTTTKSSDPDAGKTTFKGYVSDKNGKIGLTETKDKNGNVTKVTYTTYDSNGKVTGVKTYGANGKLVTNTSATTAKAARDVSQNVIRNIPRPPRVGCSGNCP